MAESSVGLGFRTGLGIGAGFGVIGLAIAGIAIAAGVVAPSNGSTAASGTQRLPRRRSTEPGVSYLPPSSDY